MRKTGVLYTPLPPHKSKQFFNVLFKDTHMTQQTEVTNKTPQGTHKLVLNNVPAALVEIVKMLNERYEVGYRTYGVPFDESVPPSGNWETEIRDELLDALNYQHRRIQELQRDLIEGNRQLGTARNQIEQLLDTKQNLESQLERSSFYEYNYTRLVKEKAELKDKFNSQCDEVVKLESEVRQLQEANFNQVETIITKNQDLADTLAFVEVLKNEKLELERRLTNQANTITSYQSQIAVLKQDNDELVSKHDYLLNRGVIDKVFDFFTRKGK